jgi:hypothetical protein
MLLDFGDDVDGARLLGFGLNAQRVVDLGEMTCLEFDVDHRADHLDDFSDVLVCHG